MIVWKGWGILVLPIVALFGLLSRGITVELLHVPEQSLQSNIAFAISFFFSAIIVWFLGRRFNHKSDGRIMVDKETGEEFKMGTRHSFFFIKMEYWAFILPVIGVIYFIDEVIS